MKKLKNKSKPWTETEHHFLLEAMRRKWTVKKISERLSRTQSAVYKRAWLLKNTDLMPLDPYPEPIKGEKKTTLYRAKYHTKPKANKADKNNSRTRDLFIVSATSSLAGGIIGAALYALLSV